MTPLTKKKEKEKEKEKKRKLLLTLLLRRQSYTFLPWQISDFFFFFLYKWHSYSNRNCSYVGHSMDTPLLKTHSDCTIIILRLEGF